MTQAIDLKLPPLRIPDPSKTVPVSLYVGNAIAGQISTVAAESSIKESEAASRLAYAALCNKKHSLLPLEKLSESSSDQLRDKLQNRFFDGLSKCVRNGGIAMGEASTGVGKTRVGGRLAKSILDADPKSAVWVCAPSVQNVIQTFREYTENITGLVQPTVFLGRGQFISEGRVLEVARELELVGEAPESLQPVRDWLSNGALPLSDEGKLLREIYPDISHLAIDLESLLPTFPLRDCLFRGDTSCAAHEHYEDIKEAVQGAHLVLCTQAMITMQLLRLKGDADAPWTHMIIDEGHLLEESVSSALGADLSFLRLRSYIRRKGGRLASKIKTCNDLFNKLQQHQGGTYLTDTNLIEEIESFARNTAKLIQSKTEEDNDWKDNLLKIGQNDGFLLSVSLSPVKHYPTITCGPPSVKGILAKLWKSLKAAALMSGTLYLPLKSGKLSPAFQRSKLNIPSERTCDLVPIIAPWITKTPTLMFPSSVHMASLTYGSKDENLIEKWKHSVANLLNSEISKSAKGGILVLCNATQEAKDLSRILKELCVDEDRIICGVSITSGKRIFKAKRKRHIRPIWLATGPAWTGLDLKDDGAPESDYLLTDVVIPRLPFNSNRTSTHIARKEWMGYRAEICDTAFRLRQGIGRLIRSEGLKSRKIWILDARIWKQPSYQLIRNTIAVYSKKREF